MSANSNTKRQGQRKTAKTRRIVYRLSRKISLIISWRPRPRMSRLLATLLAACVPPAMALPTGERIVSGNVSVQRPDAASMTITQTSQKGVIDWTTYGIGVGESVRYLQPGAQAVTLNRVIGGDPSAIFGNLTANGQVFLVNPAGIYFAPGAQVDVGGLVASTLDIRNEDFLAGRYRFVNTGAAGIDNRGILTGKYVALIAPQIDNRGSIVTTGGTTALAAGDRVSLDYSGDGLLTVSVDAAAAGAVINQSGAIAADGGRVLITARSANALMDTVLNMEGVVRAQSIGEVNGVIILDGGEHGVTSVSGTISARGVEPGTRGGTVKVLGQYVGVGLDGAAASIDASGDAGGGTVLIGGNWQGRGPEANAAGTFVGRSATLSADAITSGNGGTVVVWADQATRFLGSISARGGASGGNGGIVEVSGKQNLAYDGYVDVGAILGQTGTVLLDPYDLYVGVDPGGGRPEDTTDPFQTTGSDYWVNASSLAGNASYTLQADRHVIFNANVVFGTAGGNSVTITAGNNIDSSAYTITTAGGALSLNADTMNLGAINTNGGLLTINNTGNATAAGVISGAGGLTKNGIGTLTLTAANTYTGFTTVNAGTLTVNGTLASTTININGGTLTLGANDRLADAAAVTLNGGTLNLGTFTDTVGTFVAGGGGTLAGTGTLTAASYTLDAATIDANLGAGTLTKTGTGTATLNGTAAATTVNVNAGGTLTLGSAGRFTGTPALTVDGSLNLGGNETVGELSGAGVVGLGAHTLTVNQATNTTYAGILTGTGDLTKAGGGILTLTGNSTYTGTTAVNAGTLAVNGTLASTAININGGTLTLGANDRLADAAAVTVNGGTLNLGTYTDTVGTFVAGGGGTLAGTGTLTAASYTLDAATIDANLGAGTLTKTGTGTATLNGTAAATTVNVNAGGTLTLGSAGRFTGTPALTLAGTLNLAGAETASVFTLNAGTLAGAGHTLTATTYNLNGGTLQANLGPGTLNQLSGTTALNGTAGSLTVNINGGTLTLGANDRLANTAAVTVNGGTLNLGTFTDTVGTFVAGGGGTLAGTGTLTAASYTLDAATIDANLGAGTLTKTGTGTATLNGTAAATTVNVNAGGTLTLGSAGRFTGTPALTLAGTLNLAGAETASVFTLNAGTLAGAGHTLTATTYNLNGGTLQANLGPGTLNQLSGTTALNGTSGSLTVNINGGTLTLGANDRLADAAAVTVNGGTLNLGTFTDTVGTFVAGGGGTLAGTGTLTAASYTLDAATIDANLGAGTLTKTGTGTATLNGTAAATTVNVNAGGTLTLGSAGRFTGTPALTVDGSLNLGGNETVGELSGAGVVGLGAHTLTVNQATNTTYAGILTGTGDLTKAGGGILTLTGNSTYTGTTAVNAGTLAVNGTLASTAININGGTLTLGANDRLADAAAVTVNGGTLNLGTYTDTVGTFVAGGGGTLAGTGTLTAASYTLDAATIDANLGAGTLTKTGTGTATLNGTAAATTVNVNAGGTLTLGAAGRFTGTPALTLAGTLNLAGAETASVFTLNAGTLAGVGHTLTATTYNLNGGTLHANLGLGTLNQLSGTTALNGTAGSLTVNINGGTLTLGANDRLANTAAVTVNGGTLNLGTFTDTVGTFVAGGGGTLAGTGTLTAASYTLDAATIDANLGAGTLTKTGTGTATLNGTAAATTVNVNAGGTLTLGSAGRFTGTPALTVDGSLNLGGNETVSWFSGAGTGEVGLGAHTLTVDQTADTIYAGILSGMGGLTKGGGGTLTLTGSNTHGGTTLVSAGSLVAANPQALGATTGGTVVASGANLHLANVAIGAEALSLAGMGTGGEGVLTSAGVSSLAGNITLADHSAIGIDFGSALTLGGAIDGDYDLLVFGNGGLTLTSVVGGSTPLSAFISAPGVTVAAAGISTHNGPIIFGDDALLAGTYTTNGGAFDIDGQLSLSGNTTVNTGNGAIHFASAIDGAHSLNAHTTGSLTFGGAIGGSTPLAQFSVSAGAGVTLPATALTGNLTATVAGGGINASGNLVVGGTATLAAGGHNITLGNANDFADTVTISSANNVLLNDVNDIYLGAITATNLTVTAGTSVLDGVSNLSVSGVLDLKAGSGWIGLNKPMAAVTASDLANDAIRLSAIPSSIKLDVPVGRHTHLLSTVSSGTPGEPLSGYYSVPRVLLNGANTTGASIVWYIASANLHHYDLAANLSGTLAGQGVATIIAAAAQDLFDSINETDNINVAIEKGFITTIGVVPPGIDAIQGEGVNVPGEVDRAQSIEQLSISEEELRRRRVGR